MTTSIDEVEIPPTDDIPSFIKRGDDAPYAAKHASRKCVRCELILAAVQLDQVMSKVSAPNAGAQTVSLGA